MDAGFINRDFSSEQFGGKEKVQLVDGLKTRRRFLLWE